jgi:2Fe-2S ferredoxin
MPNKIRFTFVYPNGDEIECLTEVGRLLYDAAVEAGIGMDELILPSCKVSIQIGDQIRAPNQKELDDFGEVEAYDAKNHRYAHMYVVGSEMQGANVFLNMVRITYFDRSNQEYKLSAILNENFMSLRDRNSTKIDLSFSCRGGLACATCHCIMVGSKEEPSDDEVDLLQYSDGFCDESRLGCQIKLIDARDTQVIKHPKARRV